MAALVETLRSGRVLLMDGAMGTELLRAGAQPGECSELWNLTQPGKVQSIHQGYIDAGAECLLTHTFQANHEALARHGIEQHWQEIVQAAVANARSVCGPNHFVLGDLGPESGMTLPPECRACYAAFIESFNGVDGLLLETASGRDDLIALLFVRTETPRVPFLFSLTYGRNHLGEL